MNDLLQPGDSVCILKNAIYPDGLSIPARLTGKKFVVLSVLGEYALVFPPFRCISHKFLCKMKKT